VTDANLEELPQLDIESVEVIQIELPMRKAHIAAGHSMSGKRKLVYLKLHTDLGIGWGECAALDSVGYSPESSDGEFDFLARSVRQMIAGSAIHWRGHSGARCAFEMAQLDASLRSKAMSLADYLGFRRNSIAAVGVVGLGNDSATFDAVEELLDLGYQHVKLKITSVDDFARIAKIKRRWPDLKLRGDANGSLGVEVFDSVADIDAIGLELLEQPFSTDDDATTAQLADQLHTPVALDESLYGRNSSEIGHQGSVCDVFALKPASIGGVTEAWRAARLGQLSYVGGMVDGPLGRAANLALAASLPTDIGSEIAPDGRWFDSCIVRGAVKMTNGLIDVPIAAGVGEVNEAEVLSLSCRAERS
jgi:o-succinylbenzoate synthase